MTGTKITETVTVTDAEGNVISSSEEETGSEKKEWTEEDDGNGERQKHILDLSALAEDCIDFSVTFHAPGHAKVYSITME